MDWKSKKDRAGYYEDFGKNKCVRAANAPMMRKYWWIVHEITNRVPYGKTVLDVGCAGGGLTIALAIMGYKCTAMDLAKSAIKHVRDKAKWLVLDDRISLARGFIEDITDVVDGPFDCIVLSSVLEHVDDPVDAYKKAISLLSPGGVLLATVPLGKSWYSPAHIVVFSSKDMAKFVVGGGVTVVGTLPYSNHPAKRGWHTIIYTKGK